MGNCFYLRLNKQINQKHTSLSRVHTLLSKQVSVYISGQILKWEQWPEDAQSLRTLIFWTTGSNESKNLAITLFVSSKASFFWCLMLSILLVSRTILNHQFQTEICGAQEIQDSNDGYKLRRPFKCLNDPKCWALSPLQNHVHAFPVLYGYHQYVEETHQLIHCLLIQISKTSLVCIVDFSYQADQRDSPAFKIRNQIIHYFIPS